MNYEAVIGLEIHAQLQTATKIFCVWLSWGHSLRAREGPAPPSGVGEIADNQV